MALFQLENVGIQFGPLFKKFSVLEDVNLSINAGDFVVLKGASGSGKSTLLYMLAGVTKPSRGKVFYRQRNLYYPWNLRPKVGFIFQDFQLIQHVNVLNNVMMPMLMQWHFTTEMSKQAKELLDRFGLSHRLNHKPHQLSGGEMQRVALARALMTKSEIIFADEPTGNLDEETEKVILKQLMELQAERQFTLICASHSPKFIKKAKTIFEVADKSVKLTAQLKPAKPKTASKQTKKRTSKQGGQN